MNMRNNSHWLPAFACLLLVLGIAASPGAATSGPMDTYVAGTTVVVKQGEQRPLVDDNLGLTICNKSTPLPSVGGGCVAFGPWNSILVQDAAMGTQVAYQVCIDNDGDSLCTFFENDKEIPCGDQIYFSHDDNGIFYNPLGPLPMGFKPGCPGGPWHGYVVFLCTGVHNANGAHAHAATAGSITGVFSGTGYGDFCGIPANSKAYQVR